MAEPVFQALEARGIAVHTVTHAFGGLSRAMRSKFNTHVIGDIVANTLRIFGQGMKVAVEITLMAADCGAVRTDETVVEGVQRVAQLEQRLRDRDGTCGEILHLEDPHWTVPDDRRCAVKLPVI